MRDPKSVRSLLQQTSATISVPQVSIETPNFDKKIVRAESQANAMLSSSSSASSLLPPASSTPAFQRALTSPSASIAASPSSSTIPPSRSSRPELDFLIGLTTEDAASGLFEAEASSRAPLFDESEAATDALLVRHPESDEDGEEDYIQIQRMDAIQAALTSIIAKDEASSGGSSSAATPAPNASVSVKRSKSTSDRARRMGSESSMARSLEALPLSSNQIDPPSFPSQTSTPPAPSPSAKSLSSSVPELPEPTQTTKPLRKRVFEEDDDPDTSHLSVQNTPLLYQYADSDDEDVHPHDPNSSRSRLFFASPGDLQLPAEIARLGEKISTLQGQEPILDALIRKAELTGADAELELLNKSHSGLQQEIRALIFQKHQFEQQELDNRLEPGRTRITIPGTMEGNDPSSSAAESGGGKAVVRYLVQVEQLGQDGGVRYGWVVRRRYNDFWELQKGLKESVRETRGLGLPGKMGGLGVGGLAMSASWVDGRRLALERYMQVCDCLPFRLLLFTSLDSKVCVLTC
jgi:sorting nexin-25